MTRTIDVSIARRRPGRIVPDTLDAVLTCDHAASSHGLPVVVLADGTALGPAESGEVHVRTYVETDDVRGVDIHRTSTAGERDLIAAARQAGYQIAGHVAGDRT